uniref:Cytochrome P450 n=1 Tax=Parastrongyloides trichosuri TaxID=131310 RepID=A0A0N4ZM38_PARTI
MIGLLILSLIFIYLFNFYKKVKSLPPGPIPIPIFGNLFTCDIKNIHNWVLGLKKQYGSVFTIWLPYPQVIFADYDTINESLVANGDHFIGRNIYAFPEKMMHEKPNVGVIMSEGDEWRDQRRLSVQILRNFGMSRTIIEDKIQLSIDDSLEYLDSLKDKEHVDIAKVLQLAVGNVINLILFGYMHKHGEEKELNEFVEAFENS